MYWIFILNLLINYDQSINIHIYIFNINIKKIINMLRLTQTLIKYNYQGGQFGKYARLYPL